MRRTYLSSGASSGSLTLSGDVTGTTGASVVSAVNGATVPASGALTTGNAAYVSGVSALTYSALNLAGGSGWVTGALPSANQAAQTMSGDVTGTTATSVVSTLTGTGSVVTVAAATTFNKATGNTYQFKVNATTALSVGAGFISVGSAAVASAGDIRLSATGSIKALDGSAADINAISCASGIFTYGGTVNTGMVYGTATGALHSFQVNGTTQVTVGALGLGVGSGTLAAAGAVRFANNATLLAARNAANSADLVLVAVASSNTTFFGGDSAGANAPSIVHFNSASTTNISTAGSIRVQVTGTLVETFVATQSFGSTVSSPLINQSIRATDAATQTLTISGQAAFSTGGALTNINGGPVVLRGGAISTSTAGGLKKGFRFDLSPVAGGQLIEGTEVIAGARKLALNMAAALTSTAAPANTGDLVTLVGNAATVPTAAAVGAGILYSNAGAGTWYGTGGTVTAFGPA